MTFLHSVYSFSHFQRTTTCSRRPRPTGITCTVGVAGVSWARLTALHPRPGSTNHAWSVTIRVLGITTGSAPARGARSVIYDWKKESCFVYWVLSSTEFRVLSHVYNSEFNRVWIMFCVQGSQICENVWNNYNKKKITWKMWIEQMVTTVLLTWQTQGISSICSLRGQLLWGLQGMIDNRVYGVLSHVLSSELNRVTVLSHVYTDTYWYWIY